MVDMGVILLMLYWTWTFVDELQKIIQFLRTMTGAVKTGGEEEQGDFRGPSYGRPGVGLDGRLARDEEAAQERDLS